MACSIFFNQTSPRPPLRFSSTWFRNIENVKTDETVISEIQLFKDKADKVDNKHHVTFPANFFPT